MYKAAARYRIPNTMCKCNVPGRQKRDGNRTYCQGVGSPPRQDVLRRDLLLIGYLPPLGTGAVTSATPTPGKRATTPIPSEAWRPSIVNQDLNSIAGKLTNFLVDFLNWILQKDLDHNRPGTVWCAPLRPVLFEETSRSSPSSVSPSCGEISST